MDDAIKQGQSFAVLMFETAGVLAVMGAIGGGAYAAYYYFVKKRNKK